MRSRGERGGQVMALKIQQWDFKLGKVINIIRIGGGEGLPQ
jgi:hypothetical protein